MTGRDDKSSGIEILMSDPFAKIKPTDIFRFDEQAARRFRTEGVRNRHKSVFLPWKEVNYVVYYESIKRELKIRPIYECRCDERLKTKVEESTHLTYTGLLGELEHLKIMTSCLL